MAIKSSLLVDIIENLIWLDELAFDLSDSLPDEMPKVRRKIDKTQEYIDLCYKVLELKYGITLLGYRKL